MARPDSGGPIRFNPPLALLAPEQPETVLTIAGITCRFGAGLLDLSQTSAQVSRQSVAAATSVHESVEIISALTSERIEAMPSQSGEGWLGDRMRAFRVYADASGRRIEFDPGMVFRIDAGGSRIDCLQVPADAKLRSEWLLGPALLLALAARGVYALHASAIASAAGAVLLLGRSGSGKSTLARVAADYGWRALADDVVPITEQAGVMRVRPRFPQLKWPDPLATADGEWPLAALVFVERGAVQRALTAVPAAFATRGLLRDTVAARLFSASELAAHLGFCARLAELGRCLQLDLPEVAADRVECEARAAVDTLARFIGG